ncbi:MAG: YciI family protein [Chthoniobacteraceae bacterium]
MKESPTNQYMFLVRGACGHAAGLSPEQMQAHMTEVYAWIDGLTKQGVFSAAQPLTPEGKLVSGENGGTVTDGVFAESKEAVAGFFILNTETMEEAVNIARSSPMIKHGGHLEVRRVAELKSE